jgi:peptide-methionine (R)-S-oxide reductase
MQTSETGYDITPLTEHDLERLAADLTEEERLILLNHGTEPPFCGTLLDNKLDGVYACRMCGLPLFASVHKFDSGTGWPSFYRPFDKDHLVNIDDTSYGMRRTEIRCARCGGHQGHVFPDGPPPTGQRYCLNSASLEFFPDGADIPQKAYSDFLRHCRPAARGGELFSPPLDSFLRRQRSYYGRSGIAAVVGIPTRQFASRTGRSTTLPEFGPIDRRLTGSTAWHSAKPSRRLSF